MNKRLIIKTTLICTGIYIVLAAIAVFVLNSNYQLDTEKRINVIVATNDILPGEVIKDFMVEYRNIRESDFSPNMLTQQDGCINFKTSIPVRSGDYIFSYNLIPPGKWKSEDTRTIVLPMTIDERLANLIQKGSSINIKVLPKGRKTIPKLVLSRITVSDMLDENGLSTGDSIGSKKSYAIVVLNDLQRDAKRGFIERKEAQEHEAKMRLKLAKPTYSLNAAEEGKKPLKEYLTNWLEQYAKPSVRPNTYGGYERNIRLHVNPTLGDAPLNAISAPILDQLYRNLLKSGLAVNTVKYVHRTLSIALQHAVSYQYIESNPTRNTLTKFTSKVKTPAPYTIDQMHQLLEGVKDTQWEFIIILGGLYGMRRNEVLGLQWSNVDRDQECFHDLRHAAATNMHQLTGDFYTVGEILGHSLKGIGNQLGFIGGLEAVTERYVDVRLERKRVVLEAYHKAVQKKGTKEKER